MDRRPAGRPENIMPPPPTAGRGIQIGAPTQQHSISMVGGDTVSIVVVEKL